MTVPTPRTALDSGRATEERIAILESRIGSLPTRLQARGARIEDWDSATSIGYYWSPDGWMGQVFSTSEPMPALIQERRKVGIPGIQRRAFDGLAWSEWMRQSVSLEGTSAQRALMTPGYWDFWKDTDGTGHVYVGNKTGQWRQFSGVVVSAARAWDTTSGTDVGRTDVHSLPTTIDTTENIAISPITVGTGYASLMQSGVTRSPTTTDVQVRFLQILSAATQAYTFSWQITQN